MFESLLWAGVQFSEISVKSVLLLLLNIFYFELLSSCGSGIAPPSNVNSLKTQKELLMDPLTIMSVVHFILFNIHLI